MVLIFILVMNFIWSTHPKYSLLITTFWFANISKLLSILFEGSLHIFMMFIGLFNTINLIDPSIWSEIPGADEIATNNGSSEN